MTSSSRITGALNECWEWAESRQFARKNRRWRRSVRGSAPAGISAAAVQSSYFSALFSDATRQLGFHPFVTPSALLSEAYTDPDGIARPACEYCGYCSGFGCMVGAKAQPTNTILPVWQDRPGFELRTMSWARRVLLKNGRVTGVHYSDDRGNDFFQPATIVVLASWILNNVRLLLLSKIGRRTTQFPEKALWAGT